MPFNMGQRFIYSETEYVVTGIDAGRSEIECQTVPSDGDFYWFYVRNGNVEPIFPCIVPKRGV